MSVDVSVLTQLIDDEIIRAMGVRPESWLGRSLRPILKRATWRFSEMFAQTERVVAEQGLPAGASYLLSELVTTIEVQGADHIPHDGPLVIASNHPGLVDAPTLMATAQRADITMIAGGVPFLKNLPSIGEHLIFASFYDSRIKLDDDPNLKMVAARKALRHLREGGALLVFPGTVIDPDPSFMPQAEDKLVNWSRSLEIFIRTVPQTKVIPAVVSGVIDPRYMRHPITRLRRSRMDRQRLAMMMQIFQQMLGQKLDLVPRVSFGEALDLQSMRVPERAMEIITDSARQLLRSHLQPEGV